jgi:hypothetical protein
MEVEQTDVQDTYCVFEVTLSREEIEQLKGHWVLGYIEEARSEYYPVIADLLTLIVEEAEKRR